jgi:hypothetical protein
MAIRRNELEIRHNVLLVALRVANEYRGRRKRCPMIS